MADGASRPALDLARFAPDLRGTCEEYKDRHRARVVSMIAAGEPGTVTATEHARVLDGLLGALYCAADATARTVGKSPKGRTTLLAVGSYGRGAVALSSDVDVLLLCDDPDDPLATATAEAFLYPLWDAGLDVGHAVRGLEATLALARTDLRTATMLLDARRIAGDRHLEAELVRGARQRVFEPGRAEILERLSEERLQRHERLGGSRYLLEPDVKNGQGGLRDLDVLLWTAGTRWGSRTLEDAVRAGALLHREAEEIATARALLFSVRQRLHLRAGRRQDRLTFEDQEEIATALGFDGESRGATESEPGELGVERFMQAYYQAARTIDLSTDRMIDRTRSDGQRGVSPQSALEPGVAMWKGHITLEDSAALATDPVIALRLYRQVVRRGMAPYSFARDAIVRAAADPAFGETLRATPEAAEIFLELLEARAEIPVRRGSILGELHEVGLLLAMIPEFAPLTGRVQHDVYHVYTVDVHSIAAIDRLRAVARGDLATELPLATRLGTEIAVGRALYLGVLLHDVGKGRGKDHSEKGAELARPIATRLGLCEAEVAHVEWLVREHLRLYHWATRRDTSDPETAAEIAKVVETEERLRDLYLLTVVDLGTTNPAALTSWKARMLDDVYDAAKAALDHQGERKGLPPRAAFVREELERTLPTEEARAFLRGMPDRYLALTTTAEIVAHAAAWTSRKGARLFLALRATGHGELAELVVVADDRPGLLGDIAAAVAGNRLAIVTAQIHTRTDGPVAVDIFHVRRAGGIDAGPPDAETAARVRRDLDALLSGETTAQALLSRRPPAPAWARRKSPAVRTEILVHDRASPRFTVVDVFTRDRTGLLHVIARTLCEEGLTISVAKVATEGERVADVFYVTDAAGQKLDPARAPALAARLRGAIESLGDGSALESAA